MSFISWELPAPCFNPKTSSKSVGKQEKKKNISTISKIKAQCIVVELGKILSWYFYILYKERWSVRRKEFSGLETLTAFVYGSRIFVLFTKNRAWFEESAGWCLILPSMGRQHCSSLVEKEIRSAYQKCLPGPFGKEKSRLLAPPRKIR